jgi:hypothetical protein
MMEAYSPVQLKAKIDPNDKPISGHNQCLTCMCWVSSDNDSGVCKARAPQPTIISGDAADYNMAIPVTMAGDGCFHDYIPKR